MPATYSPGDDSALKDVVELIAKRLDNLENKIYFPSLKFEHSEKIRSDREINAAALRVAKAAKSADNASKSAISAAAGCKSAVADTMKLTAMQRKTVSMLEALSSRSASRDDAPQAKDATAPCPATPERIRSYYDVRSSGQYPNISVLSCVATTRVQSRKYPTTPIYWLRQPSYDDDHSNVSYNKTEQSPLYNTLATKNWTVVTTTWSNTQSTPVGIRSFVEIDKQEKSPVYTPYPRTDPCVYAVQREKDKY